MVKWRDYIRNLGPAAPPTIQGINSLGFPLTSDLGDAAFRNVGTIAGTVAAGDDSRFFFTPALGASYIRSLNAKGRDTFNVEDARLTAGSSDFDTIMEALEYLRVQGGGVLQFPDTFRTYTLSETLNISILSGGASLSNVRLEGNRCRLVPANDGIGALIEINGGETGISGFYFDGQGFPNVKAIVNKSPAASNAVQARVENNLFVGFSHAFYSEADGYQFTSNTVRNPAVAGVYSANRGMNAGIFRNTIYAFAPGAHGIVLDKTDWQPEGVAIIGNVVFATGVGGKALKILSGLSIRAHANTFDQCHGVVIDGTNHDVADIDFTGNWIGPHASYDGADPMMDIKNANGVRASKDTIVSPFGALRIDSASQNVVYSSTRVRMTGSGAVGVDNNSSTSQLLGVFFERSGGVTTNIDIDANSAPMLVLGGRLSNPPVLVDDSKVIYVGVIGKNYGTVNADLISFLGVGTAAAPSLTFREDPNTGVYRHAPDVLGLAAGGATAARFDANANAILGPGALATTATEGFLHVPAMSGPPTGVPTLFTNRIPLCYDRTNNRLCAYVAGTWRSVGLS